MSNGIRCDYCKSFELRGSDEVWDWLHVQFGLGQGERGEADYCTASCAIQGIEAERDTFAARMLAAAAEADE
jgi:hypothetical protein